MVQWDQGHYSANPDGSNLERALRRLKIVNVSEGIHKRFQLEYTTIANDASERVITMKLEKAQEPKDVVKLAVKEIIEASKLLLQQIDLRFPQLKVLDTFKVFAPTFPMQTVPKETMDMYKTTLSEYLSCSFTQISEELDELLIDVEHAKADGHETILAIYNKIFTSYNKRNHEPAILQAAHLYYALNGQNGSLERKFSAKKMQAERLKGNFTAETVDERLRVQTLGPAPEDLICPVPGSKTMKYDDLLVAACAATRSYVAKNTKFGGTKRQQTLGECAAKNELRKTKPRLEKGGTHAKASTEPGYATDVITPEAAEAGDHAFHDPPTADEDEEKTVVVLGLGEDDFFD
jgi:hypothetical protein